MFIVTAHALESLRERFPELSTMDDWVDGETLKWLAANGTEFGAQRGKDKLILCDHELKPVIATRPCKFGTSQTVIATVLTYDFAMANSQTMITSYDKRIRNVRLNSSPEGN